MNRTSHERKCRMRVLLQLISAGNPINRFTDPISTLYEAGYDRIGATIKGRTARANRASSDETFLDQLQIDTKSTNTLISWNGKQYTFIEKGQTLSFDQYITINGKSYLYVDYLYWILTYFSEYATPVLVKAFKGKECTMDVTFLGTDIRHMKALLGIEQYIDQKTFKEAICAYSSSQMIEDWKPFYELFETEELPSGYRALTAGLIQIRRISNSSNMPTCELIIQDPEIDPWNGESCKIGLYYSERKPNSTSMYIYMDPHALLEFEGTIDSCTGDSIRIDGVDYYQYIDVTVVSDTKEVFHFPLVRFEWRRVNRVDKFPVFDQYDMASEANRTAYESWLNSQTSAQITALEELLFNAQDCIHELFKYQRNGRTEQIYSLECYSASEVAGYVRKGLQFLESEEQFGEILKAHAQDILAIYGMDSNAANETWWLAHTNGRLKYRDTVNGSLFGANTALKSALDNIYYKSGTFQQWYNGIQAMLVNSPQRCIRWFDLIKEEKKYFDNIRQFRPYITDIRTYMKAPSAYRFTYVLNKESNRFVASSDDYREYSINQLAQSGISYFVKYKITE